MRIERAILKMRLERAMLLEQIADKMKENPDDSDDSNSPPPTVCYSFLVETRRGADPRRLQPQDRPLRSKRAHRKTTPTPAGANAVPNSSPLPPNTAGQAPHATAPPAETPEAIRPPVFREYVPSPGADTTPAPVNGTPAGVQLPPLSSHLPASITQAPAAAPQSAPSGFAAINNPAPDANGDTEMADGGGER
jgi:hypothetical protein